MTKQEFIETLAERCDLSKADAGRALNAILDSLTEAMRDGEDVAFTGFGKFSSQRRRAREAVDPRDPSKKLRIRAAHVPKFKAGSALRDAVSQLPVEAGASSGETGARSAGSGDGADAQDRGEPVSTGSEPGEWRPLAERR